MERKRTAGLVFLKVLTVLVSAGLIAFFFLSKTESRDSLFAQYLDLFKTMFKNKGTFDAQTYIYAFAPLAAVLINVVFTICFLFAKGKRAKGAYVTVYGVTTALAFLSFFRDVNTVGLVFATNNVTLSPKTLKELKFLWDYSMFGRIYGILLIGLIVGGCVAASRKAEKKNAALKVFTTLFCLLSLTATLFPVFKSSAVNAECGFFLTFPTGMKDALIIDFTGMTKSKALAEVGKWIYFAVPALVAFNLFWTHLAFGNKRSQGFDATLHIVTMVAVLCAFLFPLCFLTKSSKADVKPLFGICYGVLLGVSLLCTILSISVGKSIKKCAALPDEVVWNKEDAPAYQELSAEEATAPAASAASKAAASGASDTVILGENDFEIGKQMPAGSTAADFNADGEALHPSFVADNIDGSATGTVESGATHGAAYGGTTGAAYGATGTAYGATGAAYGAAFDAYRKGADSASETLPDVFGAAGAQDAFLVTLTAREKAEFKKLFVDDSPLRSSRLPAYVPAGDNREFFRRVFIYIGRFRSVISPALLQKIYTFSSLNG